MIDIFNDNDAQYLQNKKIKICKTIFCPKIILNTTIIVRKPKNLTIPIKVFESSIVSINVSSPDLILK